MDILRTPMEAAAIFAGALHNVKSNTLAEYTKPTRLEPTALIDKNLLSTLSPEHMAALEQTMLSVYSGLYLVAMSITMKIGEVTPMQILTQFSTDRDLVLAAGTSAYWGLQSLTDNFTSIPSSKELAEFTETTISNPSFSLESLTIEDHLEYLEKHGIHSGEAKQSVDVDKTIHNITDESNLVVGKILNIPIGYGDKSTTIQTTVTLRPKSIPSDALVTIFKHNSRDLSWAGRWHEMRSGKISFFKDWLLNLDLIDEYRKGLHQDKTNTLMNLRSTRSKNIWAALISGRASPNAISAMIFMSKSTATEIQQEIGLKLSSFHDREKMFEGTASAWIIVVDPIRESFTIYSRGIEDSTDQTFYHIKSNNKNPKGVDINQVLNAYKLGSTSTMLN